MRKEEEKGYHKSLRPIVRDEEEKRGGKRRGGEGGCLSRFLHCLPRLF